MQSRAGRGQRGQGETPLLHTLSRDAQVASACLQGTHLAQREVRILQQLHHPLVVRLLHSFHSPSGHLYAVFEVRTVEGGLLQPDEECARVARVQHSYLRINSHALTL
jgi:hypothetical protein